MYRQKSYKEADKLYGWKKFWEKYLLIAKIDNDLIDVLFDPTGYGDIPIEIGSFGPGKSIELRFLYGNMPKDAEVLKKGLNAISTEKYGDNTLFFAYIGSLYKLPLLMANPPESVYVYPYSLVSLGIGSILYFQETRRISREMFLRMTLKFSNPTVKKFRLTKNDFEYLKEIRCQFQQLFDRIVTVTIYQLVKQLGYKVVF